VARRTDEVPLMTALTAPFPWFGGKRRAAATVWAALGDVGGYVEPFAGSAAVLLARPRFTGRRVETINDADGWLVNAWRAIQLAPNDVASHAWGPVCEVDYHARLAVYGSSFGHRWFAVDPTAENFGEDDDDESDKTAVFPDMTAKANVTLGPRSGVIVIST
jgi:hypothetical protein